MGERYEKSTKLNAHGVKDAANMWRTFNGAHYGHFECCPTKEKVAAYRSAGVRCRYIRDASRGIDDLFVHHEDEKLATEAEAAYQRARYASDPKASPHV